MPSEGQAEVLVTDLERNLTRTVIDKFISVKEATPRQQLVVKYHDPNAIDRSNRYGLFRDVGTQSFAPTVLGFDLCADAEVLLRVRTATERAIYVLRNLIESRAPQTDFTAEEIAAQAGKMYDGMSLEDLRIGLFLATEFPVFATYSGNGTELARATIGDRIFTLKDIDHAWDRHVSNRRVFLDAARSPERRKAFLENLYRFAGGKHVDIPPTLSHRAANEAGFQYDEIDQLFDDCVRDGVIVRRSTSDDIVLSDTTFAQERDRARVTIPAPQEPHAASRRVFVVHGHNEAVKLSVAAFLRKLDLEPIILHEQPNKGRTIIEKFEEHADVAFAVVLLTPDDVGGPASNRAEVNLRARQNVVLELGYFIGRLRRKRVCALMVDDVETPSDIHGVIYIRYDAGGGWRLALARELGAAGIEIDLNRIND